MVRDNVTISQWIGTITETLTPIRYPFPHYAPHVMSNFEWPYLRDGSSDPLHVSLWV